MAEARRLDGWEVRLYQTVDAARVRPYRMGENDWLSLACEVVKTLTGVEHWSALAGRYSTTPEGMALMRAEYAQDFDDAISLLFGRAPVTIERAQRGDLVKYLDGQDPHLCVCLGIDSVLLAASGMRVLPTRQGEKVWKV